MGFLDNINNKLEANVQKAKIEKEQKIKDEINDLLLNSEIIEYILSHFEDYSVFTDKRILVVDKSIVSSKKTIISINYNKISYFGIRKGGTFTLSQEIEITIGSHNYEIKTLNPDEAKFIFKTLSEKINQ